MSNRRKFIIASDYLHVYKIIMRKQINWKLLLTLILGGLITGLMVLPFTFALIKLPEEVPMALVITAQMIQLVVIVALASLMGMLMTKGAGLPGMPVLEALLAHRPLPFGTGKQMKQAVILGLLGGVLVVVLCIPFWDMSIALMKDEMGVAWWKGALSCFYGGFTEEILFRLSMMTFFAWLLKKFKLKDSAVWISIIITGVIFGLGHLGITGALAEITFDVIARAVLLNGSLSIIYGILYWKRNLESAMIAHFSTDVVLHILIPHIIAPFLI